MSIVSPGRDAEAFDSDQGEDGQIPEARQQGVEGPGGDQHYWMLADSGAVVDCPRACLTLPQWPGNGMIADRSRRELVLVWVSSPSSGRTPPRGPGAACSY
jgi:hypothetical protein